MHMKRKNQITTKTVVFCALLAAMSVVLARVLSIQPTESIRISIEAIPIFLSGILFGPIAGILVGFTADFVGSMFSFGFNPIFIVPPILYGLCGGLMRWYICKKPNLLRLALAWLPPVVLGSILYQSVTLAWMYGDGIFIQNLILKLSSRSIQFAITIVLDIGIVFGLIKSRIFHRMGIWPVRKEQ